MEWVELVVEFGVGQQVEVVAGLAAGQSGVGEFAVDGVVDERVDVAGGHALGLVDRERVPEVDVSVGGVAERQASLFAVGGGDVEHSAVNGGDGSAGAVADSEFRVVAEADDFVAGLVVPSGGHERGAAQLPVGLHSLAGELVEVADVVSVRGDDDRLTALDSDASTSRRRAG